MLYNNHVVCFCLIIINNHEKKHILTTLHAFMGNSSKDYTNLTIMMQLICASEKSLIHNRSLDQLVKI